MSRTTCPIVLVVLLALAGATATAAPAAAPSARWIVTATPSRATAGLAAAHRARPLRLRGAYVVATPRARALVRALRRRGLLRAAEPDVAVRRASAYESEGPQSYARGTIVPATLTPPAAFAPIGILDDVVDASVPDVAQAKVIAASPRKTLDLAGGAEVAHGTEAASVAAGRADGQGVIGIAPGAPLLSFGYAKLSCATFSDGILALADAGAKVINLSFEMSDPCQTLKLAIAAAFGDGVLIVASAGNEGGRGNPTIYPAVYPHVLTVGALDLGLQPAGFSSSGPGVDLAAPGEAIPVALPKALDQDGTADGVTRIDGTSFAAPMVAGAASWLIAARPRLSAGQYADLLRAGAKDAGPPGWDDRSGYGVVDLAAALAAPVPAPDRGEPNDDVDEVDGSVFTRHDPYIYTGGAARKLTATAAATEDPVDLYRVRLKARGRATVRLTPTGGANVDLYAYPGTAKALTGAKPIGRSAKAGAAGDQLRLRNTTRKAKAYYIAVRAPAAARRTTVSAPYALELAKG